MQTIIVTSTPELWRKAQEEGIYTQSTIDQQLGDNVDFIHATTPDQVMDMVNRHFTDKDELLLLLVNTDLVEPKVLLGAPKSGRAGLFPHIYGPLNLNAVYQDHPAYPEARRSIYGAHGAPHPQRNPE